MFKIKSSRKRWILWLIACFHFIFLFIELGVVGEKLNNVFSQRIFSHVLQAYFVLSFHLHTSILSFYSAICCAAVCFHTPTVQKCETIIKARLRGSFVVFLDTVHGHDGCLGKCYSVSVNSTSLRCLKPLCLLQSGILNESSQECHRLLDAIQYKSFLPSVLLCGYVTQAWVLLVLKYQVGFQSGLFGVYTHLSQSSRNGRAPLNVSERKEEGECGPHSHVNLQPEKSQSHSVTWMLLTRGRFTFLWVNLNIKPQQ